MHDVNTDENFRDSFQVACVSHGGQATYSQIFRLMEAGLNGYANPDCVREKIQRGINDGSIQVAYGVLDDQGRVGTVFSGLENQPEDADNNRVEPVYF